MENPNFLKKKYNLHNAPETATAAKRTEKRTGEKVPQNPEARIQNYLDRLERLVIDPKKEQKRKMFGNESRPRALLLLREMIMEKYVRANKDKMAEGAARVEERVARELGIQAHYGEQEIEQRGEIAVADLEKSLDNWISYLSDANEPYPAWFRYYSFRSALDLGDYDKDKGEFTKRSQGSTRLFPDIDRGALAYVEQMIEASEDPAMLERLQKAQRAAANQDVPQDQLITKQKATAFAKLSFAKQYAEGIKQNGEITPEMREETRGRWVKYQQGTDPTALWASLQNKGTAWCTKGFATAETQLKNGDFHVYYTEDKQGNPTIPRIAIRMEGQDKISNDVRGVLDSQQNLEGNMTQILEAKLQEFGSEGDRFKKKSADMKLLTQIEKKIKDNQPLVKDELVFLYEIESKIEGFGYQRDPRIREIIATRNPKEDAPVVLDCQSDQIAWREQEINPDTKAYVGPLFPGVFKKSFEHIYTSFPEGKLVNYRIEIGGQATAELEKKLKVKNIYVTDWAEFLLNSKEFSTVEKREIADLVRLTVKDLGLKDGATTDEIFKQAGVLGLELCPGEVGPNLRLQTNDKEWMRIAMKQITDRVGDPDVFNLGSDGGRLELHVVSAEPDERWSDDSQFVFRLRKLDSRKL